jgi:hypothetical protein
MQDRIIEEFDLVQEKIDRLPVDHRYKWQVYLDTTRQASIHATDVNAMQRLHDMVLATGRHLDVLLSDPHVKEPTWED